MFNVGTTTISDIKKHSSYSVLFWNVKMEAYPEKLREPLKVKSWKMQFLHGAAVVNWE